MIMKLFASTVFILISCMMQAAFCIDYTLTIKPGGTDVFAVEGDSISLECEVVPKDSSGSLKSGYRLVWSWTSQPPFSVSERPQEYDNVDNNDKAVSELRISNITEKHYREYTCTYETVSRSVTLRSYGPQSTFEYRDKIASLYCDVKASAITLLGWFKENDEGKSEDIPDDGRFSTAPNNSLVIKDPHREDAGTYVAKFDSGDECKVQYRATPLVLFFDHKSYRKLEGEGIELKCKVLGFPKLSVEWYKDGNLVVKDDNIEFLPYEGYKNAMLKIKSVKLDSEGIYKCLVRYNGTLESAKTVKLWVDNKLAPLWPAITLIVEVLVLAVIIILCEKWRKSKEKSGTPLSEQGDTCTGEERESLRHRNTANNPRA